MTNKELIARFRDLITQKHAKCTQNKADYWRFFSPSGLTIRLKDNQERTGTMVFVTEGHVHVSMADPHCPAFAPIEKIAAIETPSLPIASSRPSV